MTAVNDITGSKIRTKTSSDSKYKESFDLTFGEQKRKCGACGKMVSFNEDFDCAQCDEQINKVRKLGYIS